jgi:hypothetical protein
MAGGKGKWPVGEWSLPIAEWSFGQAFPGVDLINTAVSIVFG